MASEGYRRAHADNRVEAVPFELNRAAVELHRSRADKGWSLTDCRSLVIMERRGLRQALTTDHHFEQSGVNALMLSQPNG